MKGKQLILKSLKLKNFKGIKELFIPVNLVTTISGDNATGKTTINDAATWLLFGKDSQGRSDFEIQSLDENSNIIHFLDTEVEGVFDQDGKEITLKRLLQEKWQKPNGQPDSVLKGTTTSYYINEVPQKQKEFTAFINGLVDEKLFKLLTNPFAFENMGWKDKRSLLFEMCGDVSDEDVTSSNDKLKGFLDVLAGKSLDDFKKVISDKKKKLKEDISKIPARIDELTSSIEEIDVDSYKSSLEMELANLKAVEEQMEASAKAFEETKNKQRQIINFEQQLGKMRMQSLEDSVREVNEKKSKLTQINADIKALTSDNGRYESTIEGLMSEVSTNERSIAEFTSRVEELREKWVKEDAIEFTFDPAKGVCPHCGQTLPLDKYQEAEIAARLHFDKVKEEKLEDITVSAGTYSKKIEQLADGNNKLNERINNGMTKIRDNMLKLEELQPQIQPLEEEIRQLSVTKEVVDTEDMKIIKKDIEILQEDVACAVSVDNTELKKKKSAIQERINEIRNSIARADVHEKTKVRIRELEFEHERMGQLLSELEQQEFLTEEFTRTKVDMLEDKINSRFKFVTFKLFDQQVNGGIAECCESLINGVPFSNANNAAKINAGLDIINALVNFYNVSAPIFIDNAESVNELIDTESQVIRLVVSRDEKLVIA